MLQHELNLHGLVILGWWESRMCSSLLTGTVYNSSHNKLPVQLKKQFRLTTHQHLKKGHVPQSNTGEESWSVPTFIDKVKKNKSRLIYFWMLLFPVGHSINTRSNPALHDLQSAFMLKKLLWAATVWKLQLLLSKVPRNVHLNAKSPANKLNLFCLRFVLFKSFFLRYR